MDLPLMLRSVKLMFIALLAFIFALSVALWSRLDALRTLQDTAEALRHKNSALNQELAALRQNQAELRVRPISSSGDVPRVLVEPAANVSMDFSGPFGDLKFLVVSKKKGFGGLRSFIGSGGRVGMTAQFVKTFGLSAADVELLKERIAAATSKMDALSLSNATAKRDELGNFVITVKASLQGSQVHDDLLNVFRATLGEERYGYFVQLAGDEFGALLGSFGADERTIRIKPNPTGPGRFIVEDFQGRSGMEFPVSDREKLLQGYPLFTPLIPADL